MTIRGPAEAAFVPLIEIGVDPERAVVHEHGWQSWTPTTTYRFGEPPHRPSSHHRRVMSWRPDRVAPAGAYQGEGLLVVDPGDGSPAHRFATFDPRGSVPSIRAEGSGDRVSVSATGPVRHDLCPGGVQAALVGWAEELAIAAGLGPRSPRAAPTMWCSWYGYWQAITDRVILDNAEDIERLDLPVDVVQIDDGYQTEIGDWTHVAPTFGSLRALADELLARGRRVGIWTAPFLVGERSDLARRRPEWLVGDTDLGSHWNQRLFALDVTHPAAADHLRSVFAGFRDIGIDVFKLDFLYAGAIGGRRRSAVSGLDAYHAGMALMRDAVGPEAYVVGCGAPIIPSVVHGTARNTLHPLLNPHAHWRGAARTATQAPLGDRHPPYNPRIFFNVAGVSRAVQDKGRCCGRPAAVDEAAGLTTASRRSHAGAPSALPPWTTRDSAARRCTTGSRAIASRQREQRPRRACGPPLPGGSSTAAAPTPHADASVETHGYVYSASRRCLFDE